MNTAEDRSFEDLREGETASFEVVVDDAAIAAFASLSGDANPLHTDAAYASKTQFDRCIAHGMLLGAYVSRLVGMHLPGKRSLLLKETLEFKKPVVSGSRIQVVGTIVKKSESTRVVELAITITSAEEILCSGTAHVRVLPV